MYVVQLKIPAEYPLVYWDRVRSLSRISVVVLDYCIQ